MKNKMVKEQFIYYFSFLGIVGIASKKGTCNMERNFLKGFYLNILEILEILNPLKSSLQKIPILGMVL